MSWKLKSCNRVLKKNKERLSEILNSKRDTDLIRELNSSLVRDKNVVNELNSQGIRVIVIWECTVKGLKNEEDNKEFLDNFRNSLESEELYIEL